MRVIIKGAVVNDSESCWKRGKGSDGYTQDSSHLSPMVLPCLHFVHYFLMQGMYLFSSSPSLIRVQNQKISPRDDPFPVCFNSFGFHHLSLPLNSSLSPDKKES